MQGRPPQPFGRRKRVLPAVEVPRSSRAAVLAGIVMARGLAGFDATEKIAALHRFAATSFFYRVFAGTRSVASGATA